MATTIDLEGVSTGTAYVNALNEITKVYNNYGPDTTGNYPNVESILTDRYFDNKFMVNRLTARVFADGMGTTELTLPYGAVSMRIPMLKPLPFGMRTLSANLGMNDTTGGTTGNNGMINNAGMNTPETNGVEVPLLQVYDNATFIPRKFALLSNLPIIDQITKDLPKMIARYEDDTIMATHLLGGLQRANKTIQGETKTNIVAVNSNKLTQSGYLIETMNKLVSMMTNPNTEWSEGILNYDLDKSVIVLKYSFWEKLFSVNGGMLFQCSLSAEQLQKGIVADKLVGKSIVGQYQGVYIKVIPDIMWRESALLAGIATKDNYTEFSKVYGYIANADGTAFGRASGETIAVPASNSTAGTVLQNEHRWGAKVVRDSSVALLVSSTDDTASDFTNPITTTNAEVVAPNDWQTAMTNLVGSADYGNAVKKVKVDKTATK